MLVTSYQAALKVLRGTQTFVKDSRHWQALVRGEIPLDNEVVPMMAYRPNCSYADGAEHARLRAAITDSFDRVDLHELQHFVETSADLLIDRFPSTGHADLLTGYAKQLPLLVFQKLFGCPPEFGEKMATAMTAIFDGHHARQALNELVSAWTELIAYKRRHPGADVTSWMIAHPAQLTEQEAISNLNFILAASTQPQQNLIANTLMLLLTDDRFAGDLTRGSLPVEDSLDEVLWTTATPMANYAVHYPLHNVNLDGVLLRRGEPVVVSFAAANTDPALPNGRHAGNRAHLAWSAGPHGCPARGMARLIATVAIEKLLDRLPELELAVPPQDLSWRPGPFHRALSALPVRFPPVAP
jgi:cytochrome P450